MGAVPYPASGLVGTGSDQGPHPATGLHQVTDMPSPSGGITLDYLGGNLSFPRSNEAPQSPDPTDGAAGAELSPVGTAAF